MDNQYSEYTDRRVIDIMNELKDRYNETQSKEDYLKLLYTNPCGFKLTAAMTANYRQLKTIYYQRKKSQTSGVERVLRAGRELSHARGIGFKGNRKSSAGRRRLSIEIKNSAHGRLIPYVRSFLEFF